MSGIAAVVSPRNPHANEELIIKMATLMATRGPSYQQYWNDSNIAMTHTLLPTTVESALENQPSTVCGDVWITADARIDARNELIDTLKKHFPTINNNTTDDQLILSAYQLWGVECLDHIIGDFAFILWDSKQQRLLCATDHFGVTPLYYAHTPDGVCVSNTLNAIRLHPEVKSDLDQVAIADYLLFRINENKHGTTFEHIKHLPAGHCLIFENNTLRLKRYWRFEPRGQLNHSKPVDCIEEFTHLLKTAVADRSRTDRVSVHLSGGMDSSSVTALAHELCGEQHPLQKVTAYTYGASGDLPDLESPYARQITEQLDIEHHVYSAPDKPLSGTTTPHHLRSPEPRFSTRATTNYNMLEHISRHSNVLMTGFGGDPLLMSQGLRMDDVNSPRKALNMFKQAQHHWRLFGERPSLGLRGNTQRRNKLNRPVPEWINTDFAHKHALYERYNAIIERKIDVKKSQENMVNSGLWRRIFCWNDPGFTHIPVKVVHPFFDTRLLQFTQTLPPFPWLHHKSILRQAMQPYLPRSVTSRPKTPLPGNGLQSVLSSNPDVSHYDALLSNPILSPFVAPASLKQALFDSNGSHKNNFKAIIRATTLSDWLNGLSRPTIKHTFNGNKNHVKRITH